MAGLRLAADGGRCLLYLNDSIEVAMVLGCQVRQPDWASHLGGDGTEKRSAVLLTNLQRVCP